MINLDTLDTLIAVIIVLLVLSLVVQAIQSAIKKLLKLKSRQLEESLVDLFENVLSSARFKVTGQSLENLKKEGLPQDVLDKLQRLKDQDALAEHEFRDLLEAKIGAAQLGATAGGNQTVRSAILRQSLLPKKKECAERLRLPTLHLFSKHPSTLASPEVKQLFDDVIREFREIGRVSGSSKAMLDSISKEDLMKVLRRVGPNTLLPRFVDRLGPACENASALRKAMKKVADNAKYLSGGANAKLTELREALTPLCNDIQSFFKDETVNRDILLADVLNLREIKLGDVPRLLIEAQQKAEADLTSARRSQATGPDQKAAQKVAGLEALVEGLREIASPLADLRQEFDAVIAPLRLKLTEVENWYETVMQSFEERYNRGMKTYAFVISLCVAVWLNANIFAIYHQMATNNAQRASVLQYAPEALQRYKEAHARAIEANDQPGQQKLDTQIKATEKEIEDAAKAYSTLGFRTLRDEANHLTGLWNSKDLQNGGRFWGIVRHCSYLLFGWVIMAALLSIGAPFWHDTLEALFGVKNLLRKRGDIKNVEQEAGAGQPKT